MMTTARHVRLDDVALDALADRLARTRPPDDPPERLDDGHTPGARDGTLALVSALGAINFGSGYHDLVRKRPGLSGARTMATGLRDYVGWTGPLTGERLRAMTPADTSQIFGQELDGGALEQLMTRFATALNDLGDFVAAYDDSFERWLASTPATAEAVAESLLTMPYFRDVERLDGAEVAFYKRAQLTAADLSRAGVGLTGLDRLTAFADNLVPHVLRVEGALHLDPDLAAVIDRRELLAPGARPEIEIRAAAVVGVEALVTRLAGLGRPLPAMTVDAMLWTRGQEADAKALPRPRARSVFY